jgi:hypothetical protein
MKSGYSVLRFGLHSLADGTRTQTIHRCGDFESIESAFDTARLAVLREWQEACNADTTDTEVPKIRRLQIKDTEWGYELKKDHVTIARFWVHDGKPADLP